MSAGIRLRKGDVDVELNINGETSLNTMAGKKALNDLCKELNVDKDTFLKLTKQTSFDNAVEVFARQAGIKAVMPLSFQNRKRMIEYIKKYSKAFGKSYNLDTTSTDDEIKQAAYEVEELIKKYNKVKAAKQLKYDANLIYNKLIAIHTTLGNIGLYHKTSVIDGISIFDKEKIMEYLSNDHICRILQQRFKHIHINDSGRIADLRSLDIALALYAESSVDVYISVLDKLLFNIGYIGKNERKFKLNRDGQYIIDNIEQIGYVTHKLGILNLAGLDAKNFNYILNIMLSMTDTGHQVPEDNTDIEILYNAMYTIDKSIGLSVESVWEIFKPMLNEYIKPHILEYVHPGVPRLTSILIKLFLLSQFDKHGIDLSNSRLMMATNCSSFVKSNARKYFNITPTKILTPLGLNAERFSWYAVYFVYGFVVDTKSAYRDQLLQILSLEEG